MKTINKKLLLFASSIILFTNEIHSTRNNRKKKASYTPINQENVRTLRPSHETDSEKNSILTTSKDKENETATILSAAIKYLKSLQFKPEGRFCPSLAYRTSILNELRNEKWEKPTDRQLLSDILETLDYAIK